MFKMEWRSGEIKFYCLLIAFLTPIIVVYPLQLLNVMAFSSSHSKQFIELPLSVMIYQNVIYSAISAFVLLCVYFLRDKYAIPLNWLKNFTHLIGLLLVFTVLFQVLFAFLPYEIISKRTWLTT